MARNCLSTECASRNYVKMFSNFSYILQNIYPSTPVLWRASWPAASPPGLERALLATEKLCKGSCELPATLLEEVSFPPSKDIYTRRCVRKARRIIKDSSHPSHSLLSLLPPGRRLRTIRSRTSRLRDRFFPSGYQANEQQKLIHPTAHSDFTICHALHFNLNSKLLSF